MTTTMYAVAGQHIYIGSAPVDLSDVDLVESDFNSVTWTEIKIWSTAGAIGDAAALITTPLIDRDRDYKQKGTRNSGSMQNTFGLSRGDAGQAALVAASETKLNYPFKIVGNDAPATGGSPTPSERKFYGLVLGAKENGGGANTAQMIEATVEVNSNIVVKLPTTGSAPSNTVLPSISGILTSGDVLTAYEGVWANGVNSYTYQWKRDGSNISAATGKTYLLVSGDTTHAISVAVTATNGTGSTTATSSLTAAVS